MSGPRGGDRLAELLYLSTSHPDPFVRASCAARSLEIRGLNVTEASVARQAKTDDRELAADVAGWLTGERPLRYQDRRGRWKVATEPGAARLHVGAAVQEGLLDLGPYGLHRGENRA